jgi:hypothetical protein
MDQVAEFLKFASECLAMASKASTDELKSDFRTLARHWMMLADERQKMLQDKSQE